ncbi:tofu-6, partial [Pristionchus pacificus]
CRMTDSCFSPILRNVDPELDKKHQLEKQFAVKNIPAEFDEWKVFHAFREFGIVDDIRLPPVQQGSRFRYGFVTMCMYEDADKVRAATHDGLLKTIEGAVFKVLRTVKSRSKLIVENVNLNNMRNFDNKENVGRGGRGFGPTNNRFQHRAPFGNVKAANTCNPSKLESVKPVFAQTISAGRLPVLNGVDVVMVPRPSNYPAKPFTFFVKEKNKTKDNRFLQMTYRMCEVVKQPPLAPEVTKELTCAIVIYEQRPLRASLIRSSADEPTCMAYLVDEGKEIAFLPHAAWAMPSDIAIVPAMVCECAFAGTELVVGQEHSIPSLRIVLDQITMKARLHLHTVFLEGRVNMVTARSIFVHAAGNIEEADLVDGLVKKGIFSFNPSAVLPRMYARDEMLSMRMDFKELPLDETIARNFIELKV